MAESSLTLQGQTCQRPCWPRTLMPPERQPRKRLCSHKTTRKTQSVRADVLSTFSGRMQTKSTGWKKSTVSQTDICSALPSFWVYIVQYWLSLLAGKKEFSRQSTNGKTCVPNFHDCLKISLQIKHLYRHYQLNTEKYWVGQKGSLGYFHNILTFWPTQYHLGDVCWERVSHH